MKTKKPINFFILLFTVMSLSACGGAQSKRVLPESKKTMAQIYWQHFQEEGI